MTFDNGPEKTSGADKDCKFAVCVLASGSKGNAVFISSGSTSILIDAGLSGIELERRLKSRTLSPENLDGIIVSHEHTDHIQGVGVLSRRYNLPVYINTKTLEASSVRLGNVDEFITFDCGNTFKIKDLAIHPFSISHDAMDPAGFTLHNNGTKIGIATDLGIVTTVVTEHLKDCAMLILEANHDIKMLTDGPYPWHLKQRIKGRTGHLSNEASKDLLQQVQHDRLKHVMLAHLSEINNTPDKAIHEVSQALTRCNPEIDVAVQDECSTIMYIK